MCFSSFRIIRNIQKPLIIMTPETETVSIEVFRDFRIIKLKFSWSSAKSSVILFFGPFFMSAASSTRRSATKTTTATKARAAKELQKSHGPCLFQCRPCAERLRKDSENMAKSGENMLRKVAKSGEDMTKIDSLVSLV